ncbi:helix-turn-helix domain-containing protein [Streptomyces sp. NPDC059491]|uniref:helix-turn-helix domain-containing protein n=1 Tax=Streptomyces sp. NPDC059491 TaxID=3346850 RepID=UPI0036B83375
MGTEEILRLTVAALMARAGERQHDLAVALGQSQAQVSRKQSGRAHWSLEDVDLLAAHYDMHVLDLMAGPTHAAGVLHGSLAGIQPTGTPSPPVAISTPAPAPAPEGAAVAPPEPEGEATGPAADPGQPCVLCGQPALEELDGFPQHLSAEECAAAVAAGASTSAATALGAETPDPVGAGPSPTADEPEAASDQEAGAAAEGESEARPEPVAAATATSAPAAPRRSAPAYASASLVEQISDRVHEVLAECSGDVQAAQAELVKMAIPDVMTLLKASRVGGRYEHSEFPPTQEILRKKSQKGADEIWEGRPKWRNPELFAAAKRGEKIEVTALDMNAAYLSALKTWLPIGQLKEDTSGVHDPKRAGVHLVTPAAWDHADLPNPLGNRMEPGQLWVSESTLRLLLDCARQGLADAPTIHRSLVSGATEALLEKLRRALAESRKTALEKGDELTVAYVKAMYSKFVSTIGESSANRDLRRPDWMHIIRAKAFANLWMKAHKAHKAGLQVVEISGTDELHVVGDWRPVFPEGRDLNQVKEKGTYVLGGRR